MKLWRYLVLPDEISDFERSYLRKMNRVALIFFYLHVPVFLGVAALAGTSMLQAAILTPLVLVGPTVVYFRLDNPRAVAVASGFTAMVMGGLLVHFGQGPMQIEMHFYFFVLIALLAVFGNPAAILTAAATVAVHHFVLWLVVPASVFNYEASLWTVVVHAIFVVLESVAAVFVARSFFDNVIGLEKIVGARTRQLDQRNRDMALVLDNVGQGFVMMAADGTMAAERSTILATWLGPAPASGNLVEYLAAADPSFADRLQIGLYAVFDGIMPIELTIDQLPRRLEAGGHSLELSYRPVGGDPPSSLLVVISDVTAEIARERAELERRELMAVLERFASDRSGFLEFCDEATDLVRHIASDHASAEELPRQLHTLKGNSAMFGIESIASHCHALETQILEDGEIPTDEDRGRLATRWDDFIGRLDTLLGPRDAARIEVSDADLQRVLAALRSSKPTADIVQLITEWRLEPIARRFERVAEQANRLARRLGKAVQVDVDDHGLRLDPKRWAPFWSSFVHAVRNAIDHGVELPGERLEAGKSETAHVALTSSVQGGVLRIEIRDDGRGVDWARVRERAARLGLPSETDDQLVEALFSDGVSTKDEVSDLSGRGVGLAALRAAANHEGGRITVASEPRRGTSLRFEFPVEPAAHPGVPSLRARRMTV